MFLFNVFAMLEHMVGLAEMSPLIFGLIKKATEPEKLSLIIDMAAEGEAKAQILAQKIF